MAYPNWALASEEDIRTKIVSAWLADHGFSAKNISVEKSFDIQLGRGVFRVQSGKLVDLGTTSADLTLHPRADMLVRADDGRNLLVVEVKDENEQLSEEDKLQAISYARLLRTGGIAPFVILTNGRESRIYDSLTSERIDGTIIPVGHPHVRAGFRISADDVAMRAEALEALICLSSSNLLAFCRLQADFRMQLLRDPDPFSGKKYIPSAYIEREQPKRSLHEIIFEKNAPVVFIVGQPQQGKTCFICHTVEEFLKNNQPCLFYPAIGLTNGLLEAIREDFEWGTGDTVNPCHATRKLMRVLEKLNQKLVLFIDGYNETSETTALAISQECQRLQQDKITIVLSLTNTSLERLMYDSAGNLSYLADAAHLNDARIRLLTSKPNADISAVNKVCIESFNETEAPRAMNTYKQLFNVDIPDHQLLINNPLVLRSAMEVYQGGSLPVIIDEPELALHVILTKSKRAGVASENTSLVLSKLGEALLEGHIPVNQQIFRDRLGMNALDKIPVGLFDAALLAQVADNNSLPAIDFYSSRERDYTIAYLTRNWKQNFVNQETAKTELNVIGKSHAGLDAARWFLSLPQHKNHLKTAVEQLQDVTDESTRQVVLSCTAKHIKALDADWLYNVISWATQDCSEKVRGVASTLLRSLIMKPGICLSADLINQHGWFVNLLQGDFDPDDISGELIFDSMQDLHFEDGCGSDTSVVTETLSELFEHPLAIVRRNAAIGLGFVQPYTLFSTLATLIQTGKLDFSSCHEFAQAVEVATQKIEEEYYGPIMCPGLLYAYSDDPDALYEEYLKLEAVLITIIRAFYNEECGKRLFDLLKAVHPSSSGLHTSYPEPVTNGEVTSGLYQCCLDFCEQ